MNSVLPQSDDIISEIKEMLKNIENIKAGADIFSEMIKRHLSQKTT